MKLDRILYLHETGEHHKIDYPDELGSSVVQGYETDCASREVWLERNAEGLRLAMQVYEERNFPWPNASNVKYPLITNACTQFNARAYPALIPGDKVASFIRKPVVQPSTPPQAPPQMRDAMGAPLGPVPMQQPMPPGMPMDASPGMPPMQPPMGAPPGMPQQPMQPQPPMEPDNKAYLDSLEEDLNFQIMRETTEWEDEQDRNMMILPLIGTTIKKTFLDPISNSVRSIVCKPDNIVFDYWAKSLSTASRVTHVLWYSKNEFQGLVNAGYFDDVPVNDSKRPENEFSEAADESKGMEVQEGEVCVLEQHCWVDLDDDGYAEPYIVWVHEYRVIRIEPRFKKVYSKLADGEVIDAALMDIPGAKVVRIDPVEYFTLYSFLPSPDGSILGLGLGTLLGPHNEAVNALINQLVDAGTLSNVQGGLLARNVRTKSGTIEIVPGVFHKTEANAVDLKNGVLPWPVKEPSLVLFQLLGLLIDAGEKISSVSKAMQGQNPGQNQPATTSMAVLEQGLQVFSSIFKRTYRSMTSELRKYVYWNKQVREGWEDAPDLVMPVADPNVVSPQQRVGKAQALLMRTDARPHFYGHEGQVEAERRFLDALQIDGIDALLANPQPPGPPPEAAEAEQQMKLELERLEIDRQRTLSNIEKDRMTVLTKGMNAEDKRMELMLQESAQKFDQLARTAELTLKERELNDRNKDSTRRFIGGMAKSRGNKAPPVGD